MNDDFHNEENAIHSKTLVSALLLGSFVKDVVLQTDRPTDTTVERHFTVHIFIHSVHCVLLDVWVSREQRIFDESIDLLPSPLVCLLSVRGHFEHLSEQ